MKKIKSKSLLGMTAALITLGSLMAPASFALPVNVCQWQYWICKYTCEDCIRSLMCTDSQYARCNHYCDMQYSNCGATIADISINDDTPPGACLKAGGQAGF